MLLLDIKPVSVNAAYANARNGGRFNTKKYTEFESNFRMKMFRYNDALRKFENEFCDSKNELVIELLFYLPKKRYYTTKRKVSLTAGDASNFIKTTEDILFKMFNCLNDAQVKKISSEKKVSHDDNFNIGIKIYKVDFEI